MQRQLEETRRFTGKITRTLLHLEYYVFRINDSKKQEGLKKKKDSEDHQLPGVKLSFLAYVLHVIILDIKL
jgi:hypothetical protein